jgi:RimJ/RimL family protein N-acetyltransferase
MADLVIRPLSGPEELSLFCRLSYSLDDELADDLAQGRRRPEWLWVALRDGRLVARAGWWGRRAPSMLDFLDVGDEPDRIDTGVRLLRTAIGQIGSASAGPQEYIRFAAPDWREDARSRGEVEDLMTIVSRTGGTLLAERFRFEWRPGAPVPEPTGRLVFRPVRGDREVLDLMTATMEGTLDAHGRQDLARMSPREAAERHFRGDLAGHSSPRAWWRVAAGDDEAPVGFVFPARNDYGAIIAYLGVLPAYRGRGYIDEILAEGTRILAAQDVPRIRASTDLGNVPMARAFARAGWVDFEHSINMTWAAG